MQTEEDHRRDGFEVEIALSLFSGEGGIKLK
jgi:hypothetical protein